MSTDTNTTTTTIPGHFDSEFFQRTLQRGLRVENIEIVDVNLKDLTVGGENYCSFIFGATIKYRRKSVLPHDHDDDADDADADDVEEQPLIMKYMPKEKLGVLQRLDIYCKETVFYLDLKPKMEALMWHTTEPWVLGAKHFDSSDFPERTIILEDLHFKNFKLCSRQEGLDVAHASIVMKKLGAFHALTMAMAAKEPEHTIDCYPFGLLNADSIKSPPFKMLFGAQLLKLATLVADCPGYADIANKLHKYHEHFTERVMNAVYPLTSEINVLNHGDLWINNLFFNYDNANANRNEIKEVRFIDFQLCFYGSPGFDINYFFNTSLQLDVLQNQRFVLIQKYYDALVETLKKLPFPMPIPTYEQILNEIKEHEAYGFFVSYAFFPLMSMISVDSQDNSLEKFNSDEEFARQKVQLMFGSNSRTMEILKFTLKRVDELGILD